MKSMNFIVFFLLFVACASPARYVQKGTELAQKGLKTVDVATDLAATGYVEAYKATEEICRAKLGATSTPEQRDDCTKAFANAKDIRAKLERASELYDEAVDLLTELSKIAGELADEYERVKP